MPSTMRNGKPRIVVVSDRADVSVEDLVSRLHEAGALVDVQPDVYTAMAMLAKGADLDDVLVDVRSLDRRELGFLRLAPRYHAAVNFVVPILDGTEGRLEAAGGWLQGVGVEAIVGAVVQRISGVLAPAEVVDSGESKLTTEPQETLSAAPSVPTELVQDASDLATAEPQPESAPDGLSTEDAWSPAFEEAAADVPVEDAWPEEAERQEPVPEALPVEEEDRFPVDEYGPADFPDGDAPVEGDSAFPADEFESYKRSEDSSALSTDGGPEVVPEGPSLHEAVRMRMAENGPGIVQRRRPPGYVAPSEPISEEVGANSGDLPGTGAASPDDSTISPEELDALLTDEEIERRPSLPEEVNPDDTYHEEGAA